MDIRIKCNLIINIKGFWSDMNSLRILSILVSFSVVIFIGLKTLDTPCFISGDVNLSLIALIFSVISELASIIIDKDN